jgi:hypothetical protein
MLERATLSNLLLQESICMVQEPRFTFAQQQIISVMEARGLDLLHPLAVSINLLLFHLIKMEKKFKCKLATYRMMTF